MKISKTVPAVAFVFVGAASAIAQTPVTWVDFWGQPPSSTAEGPTGAAAMQKAKDGGYVMLAGDLNPQPSATGRNTCCAFVVTKVDATRAVEYQKSYTTVQTGGGGPILLPFGILEDSSENVVFAGNIVNKGWLVKLDGSGGVLWNKSYYDTGTAAGFLSEAKAVVEDAGANYVVAGTWAGPDAHANNGPWFALAGIDAATGAGLWAKYYPMTAASTPTEAVAVVKTSDGGLAATGSYNEPNGDIAYRLLRTDGTGTPTFDKAYHVSGKGWVARALRQLTDDTFVVVGESFGAGALGVLVLHLDTDGSILWQKVYLVGFDSGRSVAQAPDGDLLIGGANGNAGAVFKVSKADGSLIWARQFTSPGFNFAMVFPGIAAESDGSVTVAGNGANDADTVVGNVLLHLGPGGEFTGCMLGEQTATNMTVTDGTAVAEALSTDTQSIGAFGTLPPPGFGISAEAIETPTSECSNQFPAGFTPGALGTDVHATASSNGNGVFERGEQVILQPTWKNATGAGLAVTGTTPQYQDDGGLGFPLDRTADYGTIADGAAADCYDATGDCYKFGLSLAVPRPSQHWDVHFDETLNDHHAYRWTIHIGDSFTDVPESNPFYKYVETALHNGITAGCGSGNYCPASNTTRAQMAVFLLKGEHGGTYAPPACAATVFTDVPCPGGTNVNWVNQLAAEGITGGCGGGNYCPGSPVSRGSMAVFLLKGEHGGAYVAPACSSTVFTDEPCPGGPFVDWVNQLVAEGITAGCGGGNYCPNATVTRGQMAVFLTKTFLLQLNAVLP